MELKFCRGVVLAVFVGNQLVTRTLGVRKFAAKKSDDRRFEAILVNEADENSNNHFWPQCKEGGDGTSPEESPPLCDKCIVQQACANINQATQSELAPWQEVRNLISAKQGALDRFKDWLGIEETLDCQSLCEKAVGVFKKLGKALPPKSDVGCVTVGGQTKCEIDLNPKRLAAKMNESFPHFDEGKHHEGNTSLVTRRLTTEPVVLQSQNETARLMQSSAREDAYKARLEAGIDFSAENFGNRVLELFRIFRPAAPPKVDAGEEAALLDADLQRNQEVIAGLAVQGKAWVQSALNEMSNSNTLQQRDLWFDKASSTRTRIVRTLNFVIREIDNFVYVYPASSSSRACDGTTGGGVLAYVCQFVGDDGYHESTGPICRGAGTANSCCAIDPTTRGKIMYLCERWYNWRDEAVRIGTIIHEGIHHAGPSDQSYSPRTMQRLAISQQLDNAASFENFVRDVAMNVAGGGGGSAPPPPAPSAGPPCPKPYETGRCSGNQGCICTAGFAQQRFRCGRGCTCYGCVPGSFLEERNDTQGNGEFNITEAVTEAVGGLDSTAPGKEAM